MMIDFTAKQKEAWRNTIGAHHRWNISTGATRSGKTYLDYWKLPLRIRNAGTDGLILLLGNTKGTLERNILDPLRGIWGDKLVGHIGSNNKVKLFGRECYALGADKINQVSKLQGAGLSYCYGDEIATWNEEVFHMLKSRLDKRGSCFDGTCNPASPNHWLKKFIDSDADVYTMSFCIDDNAKFLEPDFIANLKREYSGTVYYDRFILGRWVAAEGVIYQHFAANPKDYILDDKDVPQAFWTILAGVDWGDSGSSYSFTAAGITHGYGQLIILCSERHAAKDLTPKDVEEKVVAFTKRIIERYGAIHTIYCDHVNVFINGCREALRRAGIKVNITQAYKCAINERILATSKLMALGRFKLTRDCEPLVNALSTALWDSKHPDRRLDDGKQDVDSLDSMEYAWSNYLTVLTRTNYGRRQRLL